MKERHSSPYTQEKSLRSSIAFLPAIISASFILLAIVILYFESTELSASIEKRLPFELAKDPENARLILNTLAGGIISLTVFSFSMVMIVLSQASSNFSPRVLPGLTTAKPHQVVLGFYIGTIIYTLLLLLTFRAENGDKQSIPMIGILLGLLFGIICLVLFVYFIHSISKSIQVDNILNSIFRRAKTALEHENSTAAKSKSEQNDCITGFNYILTSTQDGYLKETDQERLLRITIAHNLQLEVLVEIGSFVVTGTPLMQLTKDISNNRNLKQELGECFSLDVEEIVMEDYQQGVRQISEIAVKALSPGINDPGTAIKAIDFLTLLFIYRMRCKELNCLRDEQGQVRVVDYILTVDELMHRYLSPIRMYGKGDLLIVIRLLRCVLRMLQQDGQPDMKKVLATHALAIVQDAGKATGGSVDRQRINKTIAQLNTHLPASEALAQLTV